MTTDARPEAVAAHALKEAWALKNRGRELGPHHEEAIHEHERLRHAREEAERRKRERERSESGRGGGWARRRAASAPRHWRAKRKNGVECQ